MMKTKCLLILMFSLCFLLVPGNVMAETFFARQINECDEYVNLKENPDGDARSLDKVYIGEVVMASSYNDTYSYCCYNGQYGYIVSDYLTSNIQPWSDGTFYVTNCDEYISLFKMPSSDSEALGRIPVGETLDAIYYHDGGDTSGKYVYAKYNGKYGFVMWDYLAPKSQSRESSSMKARQIANCNEYVNLRENPDGDSRSLDKVYIGEVVMASSYNDTYSYCCYNGQFGFINSDYLTSNIQPWSDGTFYVTNCDDYISLRRMPLRDADVLTRIPLGSTLDAVYYHDGGDTTGKYVYVNYNGQYGFVLWDYLASKLLRNGQ